MVRVEQDWQEEAFAYQSCVEANQQTKTSEDCSIARRAFSTSCSKTVTAVVHGSAGNRAVAEQYLELVCSQGSMTGWLGQRCASFKKAMLAAMDFDAGFNRMQMNVPSICQQLWQQGLQMSKDQEKKKREVQVAKATLSSSNSGRPAKLSGPKPQSNKEAPGASIPAHAKTRTSTRTHNLMRTNVSSESSARSTMASKVGNINGTTQAAASRNATSITAAASSVSNATAATSGHASTARIARAGMNDSLGKAQATSTRGKTPAARKAAKGSAAHEFSKAVVSNGAKTSPSSISATSTFRDKAETGSIWEAITSFTPKRDLLKRVFGMA